MSLFKKREVVEIYTHLTNDKSFWFLFNGTYFYYNRISNTYKTKTPKEFKKDIMSHELHKHMWKKHLKKDFDLEGFQRVIVKNLCDKEPIDV